MSFQWIVDNAESLSIDRMKVIASTTARDGVVRSVSRGSQITRFTIKVADGLPWTTIRNYISKAEALDKVTSAPISLNHSGYDWLVKYQGNSSSSTSFVGTWTQNSNVITITGGGSTPSGYKFRAGDFIQLGNNNVYTVAVDCPYNSSSVTLHRPVIEATASGALKVGEACSWTVRCTNFPKWNLFARDQVSWDGEFTFVEVPV
jgi:hypothetical protein